MSNVAEVVGATRPTRFGPVALGLAAAAVGGWVVAALWADELFLVSALLGAVAASVGFRARRDARRKGSPAGVATAAIVAGGLVAIQVAVYALAWGIGELT